METKLPSCDCCFLGCDANPRLAARRESPYPCSAEMREWARRHRDDPGDAEGYVREVVVRDRRRS